jgi:hypothetical protein
MTKDINTFKYDPHKITSNRYLYKFEYRNQLQFQFKNVIILFNSNIYLVIGIKSKTFVSCITYLLTYYYDVILLYKQEGHDDHGLFIWETILEKVMTFFNEVTLLL